MPDHPDVNPDWISGCQGAQQHLASIDARRKSEPDYRRGFNTPVSAYAATETPPKANQTGQPDASGKDILGAVNTAGYHAATERLGKGFEENITSGTHTSFDGGNSAVLLLWDKCPNEASACDKYCVLGGDQEKDCNLKAGILAQAALRMKGLRIHRRR